MRINQLFSKFFSKFLLLFNQLLHYSEQNLTNKFREKFISQFQRVIVNNDKFNRIENLKKLIKKINQKHHVFEVIRFENTVFKNSSRIIFTTFIVKIVIRNNVFNVKKIMFIVDQIIMRILHEKNDIDKKCYRCENFKHMIRDCFFF